GARYSSGFGNPAGSTAPRLRYPGGERRAASGMRVGIVQLVGRFRRGMRLPELARLQISHGRPLLDRMHRDLVQSQSVAVARPVSRALLIALLIGVVVDPSSSPRPFGQADGRSHLLLAPRC